MLSTTFSIFNATRALPPRNSLPAWAPSTSTWPQILLLSISCVSLFLCVLVFWGYYRGGHRRAEKIDVYYTTFAWPFSSSASSCGSWRRSAQREPQPWQRADMWGWSCKDNKRSSCSRTMFLMLLFAVFRFVSSLHPYPFQSCKSPSSIYLYTFAIPLTDICRAGPLSAASSK